MENNRKKNLSHDAGVYEYSVTGHKPVNKSNL